MNNVMEGSTYTEAGVNTWWVILHHNRAYSVTSNDEGYFTTVNGLTVKAKHLEALKVKIELML